MSSLEENALDFMLLLHDPEVVYHFRNYLHTTYSQENLAFWYSVQLYKRDAKETLAMRARAIVNKYLKEGTSSEINLPGPTFKKIKEDVGKTNDLSEQELREIFNDAEDHIFQLMLTDKYIAFKETPEYKKLSEKHLKRMKPRKKSFTKASSKKHLPRDRSESVDTMQDFFTHLITEY